MLKLARKVRKRNGSATVSVPVKILDALNINYKIDSILFEMDEDLNVTIKKASMSDRRAFGYNFNKGESVHRQF